MASQPSTRASGERPNSMQENEQRRIDPGGIDDSGPNGNSQDVERDALVPENDKTSQIEAACSQRNLEELRQLAVTEGGLLTDALRRKAWPVLLAVDHSSILNCQSDWESFSTHKDEHQIKLDVERAFVYYPAESDTQLSSRKASLQSVICTILRRHPYLSYFQGYHDIAQVFLLVFASSPPVRPSKTPTQLQDSAECVACVERLSLLRIRDFMLPTLDGLNAHMRLLPNILEAADQELYMHVRQTHRSYSLSGMLTLYAHEIQEYGIIARMFDFLLATDAVMSVYLFGAIILSRRDTVFEIEPSDTDMLLHTLSKLPQPLDLEGLIAHSLRLYSQHPPQKLPHRAWRQISSNSVLKTCIFSRSTSQNTNLNSNPTLPAASATLTNKRPRSSLLFEEQTLSDGEAYLHAHAAELKRAEHLDKLRQKAFQYWMRYRGPARNLALFTVAATLAYCLRPGTNPNTVLMGTLRSIRGMWAAR